MTNTELKKYRLKKNLTQLEMAKMLDVSLNTYRNWEQGANNPSDENLVKVEELLKDN